MATIERKVMTRKIARNAVRKGIVSDHTELFPLGGFNENPNGIKQHEKAMAKIRKRNERELNVGTLRKVSNYVSAMLDFLKGETK